LCGNGEIRAVKASFRPPLVAMRWRGLSIHNISPANGAFNSPLLPGTAQHIVSKRFSSVHPVAN
jgi:hypothetical protein